MHKGHLAGCGVAIVLALAVFTATGGSVGGLGLLAAALVCPVAMGAVMWFLMGSAHRQLPETRSPGSAVDPSQAPTP